MYSRFNAWMVNHHKHGRLILYSLELLTYKLTLLGQHRLHALKIGQVTRLGPMQFEKCYIELTFKIHYNGS